MIDKSVEWSLFGLSYLFNYVSTFAGYLIPKPSLYKMDQTAGAAEYTDCISEEG